MQNYVSIVKNPGGLIHFRSHKNGGLFRRWSCRKRGLNTLTFRNMLNSNACRVQLLLEYNNIQFNE